MLNTFIIGRLKQTYQEVILMLRFATRHQNTDGTFDVRLFDTIENARAYAMTISGRTFIWEVVDIVDNY